MKPDPDQDTVDLHRQYLLRLEADLAHAQRLGWLEDTCMHVEGFAMSTDDEAVYDRIMASMVLHTTADFLFERLGDDASFDKLDPAAFVAVIVRTTPTHVGAFAEILRDFYGYLTTTGELDPKRCLYLACYFDTLLELHGAGPNGIVPTRASRRATATLARRITEARIRSEERTRKKSAA